MSRCRSHVGTRIGWIAAFLKTRAPEYSLYVCCLHCSNTTKFSLSRQKQKCNTKMFQGVWKFFVFFDSIKKQKYAGIYWPVEPETWGWGCPVDTSVHSKASPCRGAAGSGLAGCSKTHSVPQLPAAPGTVIPAVPWRSSLPDRKHHNPPHLMRKREVVDLK